MESLLGWYVVFAQQFGMTRCEADHSIFYRHSSAECVYLIVYVDDIVLISSDNHGIFKISIGNW